jgi:hypothetical protein
VLFLNGDGTVKSHQKISDTQGGFNGSLDNGDQFGCRMANLGDLDGDGVTDLAVTANNDDDGGTDRGAVWILFLNSDGTVKSHQKISDTQGGFTGSLSDGDRLGEVENVGDLDGDGVTDLAGGAQKDDDGGADRGALWLMFLNSDGTVKAHQKISAIAGNFTGSLDNGDNFASGVANIGDLDGDGVTDLVVAAQTDDDGGTDQGAVWVLFLQPTLNQPPTDIALSNAGVPENEPIDTLVGTFSTTDPDTGDTFTYSLVSGTGDDDNAAFSVNGDQLLTNAIFDFETQSSYTVRVRSTDQGGLWTEKQFAIWVDDVNEFPWIDPVVPDIELFESTTFILDLTDFENDAEDGPAGDGNSLTWAVTGADPALLAASVDPITDVLTLDPVPD